MFREETILEAFIPRLYESSITESTICPTNPPVLFRPNFHFFIFYFFIFYFLFFYFYCLYLPTFGF